MSELMFKVVDNDQLATDWLVFEDCQAHVLGIAVRRAALRRRSLLSELAEAVLTLRSVPRHAA